MAGDLPDLHVLVKFGKGIPGRVQGPALLAFEKKLRELTNDAYIEVFKEHGIGDDSKLRSEMTPEQRAKL
jgi:hypothetical protein